MKQIVAEIAIIFKAKDKVHKQNVAKTVSMFSSPQKFAKKAA